MTIRRTSIVTTALVATVLSGALVACSESPLSPSSSQFSALSADASLFAPPKNDKYSLEGEVVGASVYSRGTPLNDLAAEATGSITVSDGIMTQAEITATIAAMHSIKFVLTEPAIFERSGQVSDLIVGVGTITTAATVYNGVKLILVPKSDARGNSFDATIDIPAPFWLELGGQKGEPIQLALTFDKTQH